MKVRGIFEKIKKQGRKVLTVDESLNFIKQYKIPVAEYRLVKNIESAVEFAEKVGFPVVLKAVSLQLIHKTEAKGIILDIKNRIELEKKYRKLLTDLRKFRVEGVLVQKMVEGVEVIIGGKKDETFGPFVLFGIGGIYTELLKEYSVRVCPVNKKDAQEMVEETKYYKVLKGYRGKKCDIEALKDILLKTSKLLEENQEIVELDINPVMALKKGAVVVDARIVIG